MKNTWFNKGDSVLKIIFIYTVLTFMLILSVYPMLDILKISLRPFNSLFSTSLKIIPDHASLENFRIVLFDKPFMLWLRNSLFVASLTAFVGVIIGVFAAYAFSRFKFMGRNMGLMSFLLIQIFPAPMTLLPTFVLLRKLNLIDSYLGIIVPYIAISVPFSVWVLKGFFDTIPASIEESAYMDGASLLQTLTRIIIPLSLPALGVVTLNSFMAAWSEYVIGRIVLTSKSMHTLPVALVGMTGSFQTDWGIYSAASLITAIPVMVLFMSLSKFLVSGLTLGGVKG